MNLMNNVTAGSLSASGYGSVGSVNGSVNDSGNKLDSVLAHWDYGNPGRVVKKRPPSNRNISSSRSSGRDRYSKNNFHGHRFTNSKIPYHKKADAVDELAWSFGQADMMLDRSAGINLAEEGVGSSNTLHPHHHFLHPLEERASDKGGPASIQTHCMPSPASVNPVTPLSVSNAMTPKQNGPGSVPPSSITSQSARTPGDPASIRSPYPHPMSNGPLTPAMDMEGKLGPTTPKSVGGPPSCGPAVPLGSPFGQRSKNAATTPIGPLSAGAVGNGERKPDLTTVKNEPTNIYQHNSQTTANETINGALNFNNTQNSSTHPLGTAQVTTDAFNSFFKSEKEYSSCQDGKMVQGSLQSAYKRPALPFKEYEAELERAQITLSDSIYNSSSMQNWLNHPVKKYRKTEKTNQKQGGASEPPKKPLYRRKSQTDLLKLSFAVNGHETNNILNCVKIDPESNILNGIKESSVTCKTGKESIPMDYTAGSTLGIKSDDPFDFDPKREVNKVSDEDLYTEAGIKPSMNDLDNLFESDDSDGNGVGPTPPSSVPNAGTGTLSQDDINVPDNIGISYTKIKSLPSMNQQNTASTTKIDPTGNLPHDQLSKMFPTPPSHEHNPIASPADGEMGVDSMTIHSSCGNVGLIKNEQPCSPITDQMFMDVSFGGSTEDAALMLSSTKFAAIDLPVRQCRIDLKYKVNTLLLNGGNIAIQDGINPEHMIPHSTNQSASHIQAAHYGGGLINTTSTLKAGLSPISPMPPSPRIGGPRSQHSGNAAHLHMDPCQTISSPASVPAAHSTYKVMLGPSSSQSMKYSSPTAANATVPSPIETELKVPEANSLAINLVLSDSLLNVFRDHNFDSCTMCVCSNDGNIRGRDASKYLPPRTDSCGTNGDTNDCPNCQCGFSAVINRKLSYHSGLFYEDETEITNITEDLYQRKKHSLLLVNGEGDETVNLTEESESTDFAAKSAEVDAIPGSLLELIHQQYSLHNLSLAQNALLKCSDQYLRQLASHHPPTLSMVELMDNNYVISSAIEQFVKKSLDDKYKQNKVNSSPKGNCVHKWTLIHAPGPYCSEDIMRVMKSLQPILNASLHIRKVFVKTKIEVQSKTKHSKKPSQPDISTTLSVQGPLTWREFHRMAGPATKGNTDDTPSPLPIPAITVGHEKDFITISPLALHFWESISLEPFSQPRDVAYIVVAPDNDFLNGKVKTFFKNLSSTYEVNNL
jgi:mediator of RNA polymerase II transcription subunit 13